MLSSKSFAKINLYLEITGNDAKGYHLLDSLMTCIDLYDIVKIDRTQNNLKLNINGPYSQVLTNNIQENIIIKTINLLVKRYNFTPNLEITLTKNIPVSAGLGGGSANAATVMLMLNKLYELNLSVKQLIDISLEIGCDIAFCLYKKMALISGVGQIITDIKVKKEDFSVLIVNPNQQLSTKKVFNLFRSKYSSVINSYKQQVIESDSLIDIIKNRNNDLQAPACEIMPQIADIISNIKKQDNCLVAAMSGSGPSCFGLFRSKSDLLKAKDNITKQFPQFYVRDCKIIYDSRDI